jgi:hypothetical protein
MRLSSLLLTISLSLLAPTTGFVAVPTPSSSAMLATRPAVRSLPEMVIAKRPMTIARGIVGFPVLAVRSAGGIASAVFRRCTEEACNIGRPRPIAFIMSFVPQRRPLAQLRHHECSEGIYKVARVDGERKMILFPLKPKDECSVEDAMAFM